MSLEQNPPAGGDKRPAFTGRFPILAAETPAGEGSGERRPTFTAPASGPAEAVPLASAPAAEDGQTADPEPSGDEGTESGSDSGGDDATGTKDGSAAGSPNASADGADRAGTAASATGPTAALRPGIRSATSGAAGATVIAPAARPAQGAVTSGTRATGTGTTGTGSTGTGTPGGRTAGAPDASRTTGPAGAAIAPGAADTGNAETGTAARAGGTSAGSAGSTGSGQSAPTAVDVAGLDGPLLADTAVLRSNWERLQSGFVDDPEEAVADAAELVEQTVQALIAALRQRQRTLRELAKPAAKGTGSATDTEHLRRMMLRYRSLFNQLSRP